MSNIEQAVAAGMVKQPITSTLEYREKAGSEKVFGNGTYGYKPVQILPNQKFESGVLQDNFYLPCQPAPVSTLVTGNNTYNYLLRNGQAKKLKTVKVLDQFAETGGSASVTMNAQPFQNQRIEWYANGGSGDLIQTHYGECIWFNYFLYNNSEALAYALQNAGLSTTTYLASTSGNSSVVLAASGTQNYNMELFGSWIHMHKPKLDDLKTDILMRTYSRNSVSAGSGVLALQGKTLSFDHADLTNADSSYYSKFLNDNVLKTTYLDVVNVSYTGTITKQIQNKISMLNVRGKCLFLWFGLRSSVAATSQGYQSWTAIGAPTSLVGTVQLISANGQDLTGHGTPLNLLDLTDKAAKNLPSPALSALNVYMVPFGDVNRGKWGDKSAGYLYFDQSNIQLVFTPDASFSNGTYTVDIYCYVFKDLYQKNGVIEVKDG